MQKDANLVELEKCCRTHILLQNFVLIQPRTSPPKICKIFENFLQIWPVGGHAVRRRFEEYDLNGGAGAKGAEGGQGL